MRCTLFLMMLITTLGINGCQSKKPFVYSGQLEADVTRIVSPISAKVVQWSAKEGDVIQKNTPLGSFDIAKLTLLQQQAQAAIADAWARQAALEATLKKAAAESLYAKYMLNKTKTLVQKGAMPSQNIDDWALKLSLSGSDILAIKAQLRAMQTTIDQAKINLKLSQKSLDDAKISAPLTGTILNQLVQNGEWVTPGTPLAEMADLSNLTATVYVPLAKLPSIKLGNPALVYVDGMPGIRSGHIKWISATAEFTPKTILTPEAKTTLVYAVKIAIDNPDGALKIGMPIDVSL